jgi:hypothetical protein
MAGQQALLVLDNAASSARITPIMLLSWSRLSESNR